ncbi:MAG: cytochrome c peroxidase [Myxococcota bacterium]
MRANATLVPVLMRRLYTRTSVLSFACLALLVSSTWGCARLSDEEFAQAFQPLEVADLPASPTNAWADDPKAGALGRALFLDERMSSDGTVSCASCHDSEMGFGDARAVSLGVEGRAGTRHAPGIWNVAYFTEGFVMWDGRADSLWAQPLGAIEAVAEMDFTRAEVYWFVLEHYREAYEEVFGAIAVFEDMPRRAKPGDARWGALDAERQEAVNRVFVNVGKAIEAYERTLLCTDTRFDRYLRGEEEFTRLELRGARSFVVSGCIECHSGAMLSDGKFHNLGISSATPEEALGRARGQGLVLASAFNGAGAFSDDTGWGQDKLDRMLREEEDPAILGAFKTPSLRGVSQRGRWMHDGSVATLEAAIDHYSNPDDVTPEVGVLSPKFTDPPFRNPGAMEAFLRTLDCAAPGD